MTDCQSDTNYQQLLHQLLAAIHRDGGQRQQQLGTEQAVRDAITRHTALRWRDHGPRQFGDRHTLARNLTLLMEDRVLTVADIASQSGVSTSTVSSMARGLTNPGIENLVAIANALEVSIDRLLDVRA